MLFRGHSKMRSLQMSFNLEDKLYQVDAVKPRNGTQARGRLANVLQHQEYVPLSFGT